MINEYNFALEVAEFDISEVAVQKHHFSLDLRQPLWQPLFDSLEAKILDNRKMAHRGRSSHAHVGTS